MVDVGQSADTFHIAGRGMLHSFHAIPGLDPRALTGQEVIVDGRVRKVRAVETFAIVNATGTPFSLLLEPLSGDVE